MKVLEIGAGTGGTTSALLPVLNPETTSYTFTDVSRLFLDRAAEKFSDYGFLRYGLLDIERDLLEQGYPAHEYDVVIAANVVHATGDLRNALDRIRLLLGSQGILILLETTEHPAWLDITTGLIEGWQKFDDDLRTDNPLLSAAQWCELLCSCGFEEAASLPETASPAEVLGQHVLIARAPVTACPGHSPTVAPEVGTEMVPAVREKAGTDILTRLESSPPGEQIELLAGYVRQEVIRVLGMDRAHTPDLRQRLMELGVDSLMAIELRNRISTGLGLKKKLTATLIFDYPTIQAIAEYLAHEVLALGKPQEFGSQSQPAAIDRLAAEIEKMDDAEAEIRLLEKLKEI